MVSTNKSYKKDTEHIKQESGESIRLDPVSIASSLTGAATVSTAFPSITRPLEPEAEDTSLAAKPVTSEGNRPIRGRARQHVGKWLQNPWVFALRQVLPVYVLVHIAFGMLSYFAVLFVYSLKRKVFLVQQFGFSDLLHFWYQWDTVHFLFIAAKGYDFFWRTAFFPLYPLAIHSLTLVVHHPLIAALLISNGAGLGMMVVLYRLVQEDFDKEIAYRTVLYLAIFPTAFFF
ncbi:MAG: hypothetical protein M3Z24_06135, partial [Chloroflexota bacterium]|nr:hypothetical protein [Chloroflexota bacterium]